MAKKKQAPPALEYRLIITSYIDDLRQTPMTRITLETVQVFASFRYELSIREHVGEKELRYEILGLKAPRLDLPATGTAQFVRDYPRLKGTYTIVVAHIDGTANTFVVQCTAKQMKVLQSPKHPFVELIIA
ncbi:MAG: hypothetical protein C4326_00895 [Ignavibacteria bacterium]